MSPRRLLAVIVLVTAATASAYVLGTELRSEPGSAARPPSATVAAVPGFVAVAAVRPRALAHVTFLTTH